MFFISHSYPLCLLLIPVARTYNAGAFGNQYKYNLQHCTIVKH